MKKLMIAAAVAVLAVATQASTIRWAANNIAKANAGDSYADYTVLCYFSQDDSGEYTEYTAANAVKALLDGTPYLSAEDTASINDTGTLAGSLGDSVWSSGDFVNGFAIVLDGDVDDFKNYMVIDGATAQKFTGGNQTKTIQLGDQTANTWVPAPEPTTGLLMLIGMAGLALRRRRA